MAVLSARPNLAKRSKTTHAWSLKGARQSAFTVLEFFNREPFFGLRQFLGDKFSFPLAGVAFPMQRGIEPTNVEARHLCPQDCADETIQSSTSKQCKCKRRKTPT